MRTELTPLEARVIGCLIEKEITTPDQYPLSLNSLTTACNQRSNRDPVLELDNATVQAVVDGLMKKHLVTDRSGGMGGRVTRYRHRFCNTQFSQVQLSAQQLAIVCELLLRGPQTPGELRSRANRMAPFSEVSEVETALEALAAGEEPLVARLPREPGKRESRWMQLFTGEAVPESGATEPASGSIGARQPQAVGHDEDRFAELEARVATLEAAINRLEAQLAGRPTPRTPE